MLWWVHGWWVPPWVPRKARLAGLVQPALISLQPGPTPGFSNEGSISAAAVWLGAGERTGSQRERRAVPSGQSPLVLGTGSCCHAGEPGRLRAPCPPASGGDCWKFSPCCLRAQARHTVRPAASCPVVPAHSSLPSPFLWPCWGPTAQTQLCILSTGCPSRPCALPASE